MATTSPTSNNNSNYKPKIVRNPDGTYTRLFPLPLTPSTPHEQHNLNTTCISSQHDHVILTKDIQINPTNKTWLRLYFPSRTQSAVLNTTNTNSDHNFNKIPLIIYFHGGGFVFLSAATTIIHDFCVTLATKLNSIVASVEYRPAPEHQLPAAYEDAMEAFQCLKTSDDDWLKRFCDLSSCFLMGSSSGGNIAFHAGIMACELPAVDLEPLKIKGLILHHPFFGGLDRTKSELKNLNDSVITLEGCDYMWELALPVGADRDHRFCNLAGWIESDSGLVDLVRVMGIRVLVMGCFDDMLIDRQVELARILKEKGVKTVDHFYEGYHSMEISEPSKAEILLTMIKEFTAS